jgi:D-alanyl-lipoteichoic acid acyltransferase DltB (MBOAT superfamily)
MRAKDLLPQIARLHNPTRQQVVDGSILIVTGMFKKVLIGDTTGRIVDQIFGQPHLYQSPELLMAWILFSVQIYADFSGYSNIARGLGKLLGIEFMINFEQPYLSANITEFWRRWHISLSNWLREYLYIPLGGNRKGVGRTYVNLMLTMLLGGLWHGANWTFIVWGGLHGLYLAGHKLMLGDRKIQDRFAYQGVGRTAFFVISVLFTNVLVLISWLFFRAKDFSQAWYFLSRILHWQSDALAWRLVPITATFLVVLIIYDVLEYATRDHTFLLRMRSMSAVAGVATALMLTVFLYMATSKPLPFVYFQF